MDNQDNIPYIKVATTGELIGEVLQKTARDSRRQIQSAFGSLV